MHYCDKYLFLAQLVERLTVVVIINQIVIGSIPIEEKNRL